MDPLGLEGGPDCTQEKKNRNISHTGNRQHNTTRPTVASGGPQATHRPVYLRGLCARDMDRHLLQLLDRTVRALGSEGATEVVMKQVHVGCIYTGSFGTRYFPEGTGPKEYVTREVTYAAGSGAVSLEIGGATYTGVVLISDMRAVCPHWSLKTVETVGGKRVLQFEKLGGGDRFTLTQTS